VAPSFQIVLKERAASAKTATADGVFHSIDPKLAAALVSNIVEAYAVVKSDGAVCGRDLPCRYHS
jgi:hypothetical protein